MKTMHQLKAFVALAGAAALVFSSQAATYKYGNVTYTYKVVKGFAQLGNGSDCAISPEPTGVVAIPLKFGKYKVTSIADGAFSGCGQITKVVIPYTVTSIGKEAFFGCTNLVTVSMQKTMKSIGDDAFSGCTSLESLTIPSGVKKIGNGTFNECRSLLDVTIPKTVTSIGEDAFMWCESLQSILIPSSVTSIGARAFCCSGLTSISIPKKVKTIRANTFESCEKLQRVTIPSSVTSIGSRAFFDCADLEKMSIPSSVKSIGEEAFYGCASLPSVTIPSGVKNVGESSFENCTSLTNAVFQNGVTSIGAHAFDGCSRLRILTVPPSVTTMEAFAFKDTALATVYYWYRTMEFPDPEIARIKGMLTSYNNVNSINFVRTVQFTPVPNNKKYGTVKGSGRYVTGTSFTTSASPKKGYVFSGWYLDKALKTPIAGDYRKATQTFNAASSDTKYYAKFITKAADKKALKFTTATKKLAKTATVGTANSEFGGITIKNAASSKCTYSASGLPNGLTIDKTTGVISGIPTRPGKFTATVTVKSAGGNKISQKVLINVKAPSYFAGTYSGYAKMTSNVYDPPAEVRLTADVWGGVSAKFFWKGKTYSATSKCTQVDANEVSFVPLSVKIGKTTYKFGTSTISDGYHGDFPDVTVSGGVGVTSLFARKPLGLITTKAVTSEGNVYYSAFKDLVGTTVTVTDEADKSDYATSIINLKVIFKENDVVLISGKVDGQQIMGRSGTLIVKGVSGSQRQHTLDFSTGIVDWKTKFYRELRVRLTFTGSFSGGVMDTSKTEITLRNSETLPTSALE